MRTGYAFTALVLIMATVAWTILSLYLVIVLEQPPALDPIGLLRTVVLAPGYLAFVTAAALATAGLVLNPWMSGAVVGVALGIVVSLTAVRFVHEFVGPVV